MNAEPMAGANEAATPDFLLQPLRFLLMRYGRSPSPMIAGRIADCLDRLLADRNFRVSVKERCTYRQMRAYWRLVESLG